MYNLCCYHPYHLHQHRRSRAAPAAAPNAPEVEDHDHGGAVVNFIQQVTGASSPKTWDDLTDPEQKKILACLFQEGIHLKKVLFSTLVNLEYISKKGAPFTTTTTAVELDEFDDDWRIGEFRILCLTSACTSSWTQLHSLEFVSQETGSICTLELQHDFNFRYSIPDKQFIVFDRKLKDKSKRLVFATTSNDKLVDFVECLNRALATMNDNTQRKLSSDNCTAVPTTPPANYSSHPPSLSPGAAGPSGSTDGVGGHEPLTAKKIIEIIKRMFERKEDVRKRTSNKFNKMDISGPTDFRHLQHIGLSDARANDTGVLIVNNVQDLLKVPTTPNGTTFGEGDNSAAPNTISPTQDKRTLSFIYDVIEESQSTQSGPPPSRSALRESHKTVQLPVLSHMTDSDNHSPFATKDASQSFPHDNDREKLIKDLQVHMQNEDTRKLVFDFIERYKQDIKSDDEFDKEKPSSSTASSRGKPARAPSPKWNSGRNSAPPPPRSPILPTALAAFGDSDIKIGGAGKREPVDERPFNYTTVRDSLRAELQHQQTLHDLQIKPGCQEKGAAALLNRANTWSTNQVKGSGSFNTLPSTKPVLKPDKLKKAHSDVRRRPTTPPPPPLKEIELGSNGIGGDKDARDLNGHRVTPDREEPPVVTKVPPPIPKPRKSMHIRRINSNPSSGTESEPRYANISTSKSFDTETGVGIPQNASDDVLIGPGRPPVPSAANTLLVAELREKIDGIKQ